MFVQTEAGELPGSEAAAALQGEGEEQEEAAQQAHRQDQDSPQCAPHTQHGRRLMLSLLRQLLGWLPGRGGECRGTVLAALVQASWVFLRWQMLDGPSGT